MQGTLLNISNGFKSLGGMIINIERKKGNNLGREKRATNISNNNNE